MRVGSGLRIINKTFEFLIVEGITFLAKTKAALFEIAAFVFWGHFFTAPCVLLIHRIFPCQSKA